MAIAEIVKLCLMFTSVALSIAALFVASRAAKHARRAEAAYARVRSADQSDGTVNVTYSLASDDRTGA